MRVTRLVGFGTLCVSAGVAVWACADDESTSAPAVPDGGSITTPTRDSGGGGQVDTGIPPADADAPDAPLWCGTGTVDGSVPSRCAKYQWDDFAATDAGADADLGTKNCKACPGRALTCADLLHRYDAGGGYMAVSSPSYDYSQTKTLTVDVTEHAGEIVGGAVTVTHAVCFSAPQGDSGTFTVPVQVHGNDLRAPLADHLDAGPYDAPCGVITYQLVDSCCTPSTVKIESYFDPEMGLYKTSCPDGG